MKTSSISRRRIGRRSYMAVTAALLFSLLLVSGGWAHATPVTVVEASPLSQQEGVGCTLTLSRTEGPYYTPNTPERTNLVEPGMSGARVLVTGYVYDANCQPVANAWLDFWQTDYYGVYDNVGYTFRGHQYTDANGQYRLQTVPNLKSRRDFSPSYMGTLQVATQDLVVEDTCWNGAWRPWGACGVRLVSGPVGR